MKKPKAMPGKSVRRTYDHVAIEKKWRKKWSAARTYHTADAKKSRGGSGGETKDKSYILDMFPYPSGEGLHVGHPKGYIATDVISRMRRMQGRNVLHPMGFDAFGLPAENYALKNRTNPATAVAKNVERYKQQLEILGFDYDWSREINTTDPKYYKWTQWIFLQMFKKGLAYESNEPINWCPSCKTGLANEDIEDGRCERCGTPVEKKPLRQWVLKITDYADRLLTDLDAKRLPNGDIYGNTTPLLDWPESIKEAQKNWIGRSEGALVKFKVQSAKSKVAADFSDIEVFTTRPDTLFGATYLVIAPEHRWVREISPRLENRAEIEAYISRAGNETEIERTDAKREKTGVELKGVKAINPANGDEIPIWIADYVLADYGTGAIMAVPAHDERDWDFAKKFNLPIKEVVIPYRVDKRNPPVAGKKSVERRNVHVIVRKKNGDFLCLKWLKHPWITFPMGGIEDGEDIIAAGKREVAEKTGYTDLANGKVVGGLVKAEYFAAHKGVNRVSMTSLVTFDLGSDETIQVSAEESEEHEVFWAKPEQMNYGFLVHAELDVWLDRIAKGDHPFVGQGVLVNSGPFNGKESASAMKEIVASVGGKPVTKYKLRDWVFSRQRYWGEPIPLIHCAKCGVVPVPEKDLPVKLPKVKSYEPTGTGESPLAAITKWVNVKCPVCKGPAKRETNTMPQWAGSNWYYIAYCIAKDLKSKTPISKQVQGRQFKEKVEYWLPVDFYVGGAEHATRHLIYARFWHKFLYDIGVVPTIEPFSKLRSVGLIMGEDGRKMSKRFGNVVNPDDIVARYGADTLRIYEMFMGPFEQAIPWSTDSIAGARRFVERIWRMADTVSERKVPGKAPSGKDSDGTSSILNKTVAKVTSDIENMRFNTAISALMIALNELEKEPSIAREDYETLLKLVAPFAPHVTDELWSILGNKGSIHLSEWPKVDTESLSAGNFTTIAVQVNGKTRASFRAAGDAGEGELREAAAALPEVAKWLDGKTVKKTVVVKGRIVNFVV